MSMTTKVASPSALSHAREIQQTVLEMEDTFTHSPSAPVRRRYRTWEVTRDDSGWSVGEKVYRTDKLSEIVEWLIHNCPVKKPAAGEPRDSSRVNTNCLTNRTKRV